MRLKIKQINRLQLLACSLFTIVFLGLAYPTFAGDTVGLPAPLTFLNAENFCADMLNVLKAKKPKLLVLEASGMLEIDFTAAQTLIELIGECRKQDVALAVARLESTRAQEAFERFGIYEQLPRDRVFRSVDEAIRSLGTKT